MALSTLGHNDRVGLHGVRVGVLHAAIEEAGWVATAWVTMPMDHDMRLKVQRRFVPLRAFKTETVIRLDWLATKEQMLRSIRTQLMMEC